MTTKELNILENLALNGDIQGNDLRVAILYLIDKDITKSELCNTLNIQLPNIYPILKRLSAAGLSI